MTQRSKVLPVIALQFFIPRPAKLGRGLCRQAATLSVCRSCHFQHISRKTMGDVFHIAYKQHPLGDVDVTFEGYDLSPTLFGQNSFFSLILILLSES